MGTLDRARNVTLVTRIGVALLLAAALSLGLGLPTPGALPSVALGSREVLWTERTLILFYGFLLLFVPLIRGLHGQLPIELSTRGARWQETAAASEHAVAAVDAKVDDLSSRVDQIGDAVEGLLIRVDTTEEGRS
jgi:hypothetical protein